MTPQETMSRRFGWLVTDFTQRVAGVAHAIVVSADGLLLTASTMRDISCLPTTLLSRLSLTTLLGARLLSFLIVVVAGFIPT